MERLNNVIESIGAILILLMTIFAVTRFSLRYAIKIPTPWIEELIRYMMISMVYLVTAVAVIEERT